MNIINDDIDDCNFIIGEIVFAKIKGYSWWPAIVIFYFLLFQVSKILSNKRYKIKFFGPEKSYGIVHSKKIDKYINKYKFALKIKKYKLKKAINKANELIEQMSDEERKKFVPNFKSKDLRLNKHYIPKKKENFEYNQNYLDDDDDNLDSNYDDDDEEYENENEDNNDNEIDNNFNQSDDNNENSESIISYIDFEEIKNLPNSNNFLDDEMKKYCDNKIISEDDFINSIIDFFHFLTNCENISYIVETKKDDLLKVISFLLEGKMTIDGNRTNKILHVLKRCNEGSGKNTLNEYLNIILDNIKNNKI